MSRENVELVQEAYAGFARGNWRTDPELFDPLVVFVPHPSFPGDRHYLGRDGITKYTREVLETTTRATQVAEELIDAEDSVVVTVRAEAIGKGSGTPTVMRYFAVWTFRGRVVVRLEIFEDRVDALEAVGLRG